MASQRIRYANDDRAAHDEHPANGEGAVDEPSVDAARPELSRTGRLTLLSVVVVQVLWIAALAYVVWRLAASLA